MTSGERLKIVREGDQWTGNVRRLTQRSPAAGAKKEYDAALRTTRAPRPGTPAGEDDEPGPTAA